MNYELLIKIIDLLRLYVFFPNSGHLMFSREFTFRLFKNYAYICSWMHVQGRHLKETVLWDNIAYGLKWENKNFKLKRSIRKGWWDNRAKGWRCMVTLKLFFSLHYRSPTTTFWPGSGITIPSARPAGN